MSLNRTRVILGIGTNQGDREANLRSAFESCREYLVSPVLSSFYETQPRDYTDQDLFLNGAVMGLTDFEPHDLLDRVLEIEKELGRDRSKSFRFGPRPIDIDILLYGADVINTDRLEVPHPRLHLRQFAMTPLIELWPDARDPFSGKLYQEITDSLEDQGVCAYTGAKIVPEVR